MDTGSRMEGWGEMETYGFILLIEVVNVSIENFNKQFNGHGGVHACVRDAEGAL